MLGTKSFLENGERGLGEWQRLHRTLGCEKKCR
jgi:hypothetical protein